MAMTQEELLAAVNAAGTTPEQLTGLLQRQSILIQIAAKQAEITRKQQERQAAIDVFDGELRALASELTALEVIRNASL